ncbi:MAG: response regulator [Nitrospinota bacterium]|nr:response regulator [Nitrospinota bacterium]
MEQSIMLEKRVKELETKLAEAEQDRDFFVSVLDSLKTTVAALDPEGLVVWANQCLHDLSGDSNEIIRGRHWKEFVYIPEGDITVTQNLMDKIVNDGESFQLEYWVPFPDGQIVKALSTFSAVKSDDKVKYVVINGMDVTKRQLAEDALLEAKESLEKANKLKDQFVTLVSHDLRSPLGNIMGMLEILKSKIDGAVKDSDIFYLTRAVSNCHSLVRMIDRLLDVSRLRTGQMRVVKRFILTRYLLEDCTSHVALAAQDKGITINTDIPAGHRIFADNHLFGEVIQNVVGNAVKFLKEGDSVTISALQDKQGSLVISDTGPGIREGLAPELFTTNKKTSTTGTKGEKGMGLGLPLCHDIMKAHGGDITVESKQGEGATFYLRLPEAKATVLVVDDQEVSRMEVADQLRAMEVDVIEAANGREALDRLAESTPHLVITDIVMPHMDGFALLEFIRKSPAMENVPVIVFTSSDEIDAREKAFRMGANDFVLKPVVANDFIPRVRRFVKA